MWTGQNHQGKSIQVSSTQRHNFQLGKHPDKIGWRLEGNLGKQHVVCVLCSPSSQSSSCWTLETVLGKPLQPLF